MSRYIELQKPYGSSEGTASDPQIEGTPPAPEQHNDIIIIISMIMIIIMIIMITITRWSFKFPKKYI